MPIARDLEQEFARLAREYGDPAVLAGCLEVVRRYAELGANRAAIARKKDTSIDCAGCRQRDAAERHFNEVKQRIKNGRAVGGAASTEEE